MPGKYWPVSVVSTSGSARLSVACQVHTGAMNCGDGQLDFQVGEMGLAGRHSQRDAGRQQQDDAETGQRPPEQEVGRDHAAGEQRQASRSP